MFCGRFLLSASSSSWCRTPLLLAPTFSSLGSNKNSNSHSKENIFMSPAPQKISLEHDNNDNKNNNINTNTTSEAENPTTSNNNSTLLKLPSPSLLSKPRAMTKKHLRELTQSTADLLRSVHVHRRELTTATNNRTYSIADVVLDGPMDNLLTLHLLVDLTQRLVYIAEDDTYDAVVLSSKCMDFFSSGPDLRMFKRANTASYRRWYTQLLDLSRTMWMFPKPLVVALNGHCPSLAMALIIPADARVMVPERGATTFTSPTSSSSSSSSSAEIKMKLGFSEVQFGITVPSWLCSQTAYLLGAHNAEKMLLAGRLFGAYEAQQLSLIDSVCGIADMQRTVDDWLLRLLRPQPRSAWVATKQTQRLGVYHYVFNTSIKKIEMTAWGNALRNPNVMSRM
eukprot:PhM_4_TR8394/c0_g2_i1/m.62448/K13238/DCI; 3,2-trans-enoyl-CoA isomerase, mitochondrial